MASRFRNSLLSCCSTWSSRDDRRSQLLSNIAIAIGCAFFAGVLAFGGTIIAGSLLESQVRSIRTDGIMLSYGQTFGLGTIPICTLLGTAIGLAFSFVFFGNFKLATALLLGVSAVGWNLTSSLWSSQIEQYGPDPSEVILYYPPTTLCIISLGLSGFIGMLEVVRIGFSYAIRKCHGSFDSSAAGTTSNIQ